MIRTKSNTIRTIQYVCPSAKSAETVVDGHNGAFTDSGDGADEVVCLDVATFVVVS